VIRCPVAPNFQAVVFSDANARNQLHRYLAVKNARRL
jgi:hypothetical protein